MTQSCVFFPPFLVCPCPDAHHRGDIGRWLVSGRLRSGSVAHKGLLQGRPAPDPGSVPTSCGTGPAHNGVLQTSQQEHFQVCKCVCLFVCACARAHTRACFFPQHVDIYTSHHIIYM